MRGNGRAVGDGGMVGVLRFTSQLVYLYTFFKQNLSTNSFHDMTGVRCWQNMKLIFLIEIEAKNVSPLIINLLLRKLDQVKEKRLF